MALELRLLGTVEIRRDGLPISLEPRLRAVLALLALRANEPVPQSELIDQLWDGAAPPTARAALHNAIHALRRRLGEDVLERQPGGYVLHIAPDTVDLFRFRYLVEEARAGGTRARATKLREADACWRGPPGGYTSTLGYAQRQLVRLEEERLAALEERIDAELALGRAAELVAELEELVARHRSRERLWAQLMLALYRAGRQADALATYRRAYEALATLGFAPGIVLRQLQRAVLVEDPAIADPARQLGTTLERAAAILPGRPQDRAQSLREYASALIQLSEPHLARATLEAAERIASDAGEASVAERARLELSWLSWLTNAKSAVDHLAAAERAAKLFRRVRDEAGLVAALRHRAHMLRDSGRADEAAACALDAAGRAARVGEGWQEATCRSLFALSLAFGSTPVGEAIARCEEQAAAREWEGRGPHGIWSALVMLQAAAGNDDVSRALAGSVIDVASRVGAPMPLATAHAFAAAAATISGTQREAVVHLRQARALTEDMEAEHVTTGAELAVALAATGAFAEAETLALEAHARSHPGDFISGVAWRRALALVAAQDGRADEALSLANEACELTGTSDYLILHGQSLEDLASVQQLAGRSGRPDATLRAALAAHERKGNVPGVSRIRARLGRGAGHALRRATL